MFSWLDPSIARAIRLPVGVPIAICVVVWPLAVGAATAGADASGLTVVPHEDCAIPRSSCLHAAEDKSCPLTAALAPAMAWPVQGSEAPGLYRPPGPEQLEYEAGMSVETLSLYKTVTYVTGATLTDQLWYLFIASAAAATGGVFFTVNAATSSMMTYSFEYAWTLCCKPPPGPDGVVPVSATKAVVYRGLSILRVGGLALIFGNTLPSSALVTGAITVSRTAVYVANDYVWNGIDARKPVGPPAGTPPPGSPPVETPPLVTVQTGPVQ